MKIIQVLTTVTVMATSLFFTACSGNNNKGEGHERMEGGATAYYCPMECEGDKTYTEKGTCPVCGMDLVVKSE